MVKVTSYEPVCAGSLVLRVNVSPAIVRKACTGDRVYDRAPQ